MISVGCISGLGFRVSQKYAYIYIYWVLKGFGVWGWFGVCKICAGSSEPQLQLLSEATTSRTAMA